MLFIIDLLLGNDLLNNSDNLSKVILFSKSNKYAVNCLLYPAFNESLLILLDMKSFSKKLSLKDLIE